MPKYIAIFDMDGTLIDSSIDITASVNYVRKHFDLAPLSVDRVVNAINAPVRNLADIFYEKPTYEAYERNLFEHHYFNECVQNVYLYDGVIEMLETLSKQGVLLSVATNAPQKFAKRMLKHLNVAHYFDYIVGADIYASKPNPAMLHAILQKYNYTQKDKAVMIGDNENDILSAKNASINGIHVGWGFAKSTTEQSINTPNNLKKELIF